MKVESKLKTLEIYLVCGVAAFLVYGVAYSLSSPFSAEDYGIAGAETQSSSAASSAASRDFQPALLDPALRSLDGVSHHG